MNNPTPPPGGKDAKNERMREILSAALEEFFQEGFAATRLDAIAERAGVAKGTIYLYFDSKETLFEEAVRSAILPVLQRIETFSVDPQGSAEAALRAMISIFYRDVIGTDRRRILRLFIAEGPRFPRLLAFYHAEVLSRGMAAMRNVLQYGVERGEFRASAAINYPHVIFGPALIGALWKMMFDNLEPLDIDGLRDAHLDSILHGLVQK